MSARLNPGAESADEVRRIIRASGMADHENRSAAVDSGRGSGCRLWCDVAYGRVRLESPAARSFDSFAGRSRSTASRSPAGWWCSRPTRDRGGSGKPAHAETGPDGGFILHLDNSRQIPAGWYRVSLAPAPVIPDPASATQQPAFPAKLAAPDLSGLEREVQAGKEHVFEFAVEVPAN